MDRDLEESRRLALSDPDDPEASLSLLKKRSRTEGPQVWLQPLMDRELWQRCPEDLQDLAIAEVGRRLGAKFRHVVTRVYDCAGVSHRIASFQATTHWIELNLLPGGRFLMGSPAGRSQEQPPHWVRVPPFLLGPCVLRRSRWAMTHRRATIDPEWADHPIELSWNNAQDWLNKTPLGLRLPTESEWEYACRAGSTTVYYWGDDMDHSHCFQRPDLHARPLPVTEHERLAKWNAFGLVDMLGNVAEWCQDDWFDSYKDKALSESHEARMAQPRTRRRVHRGGRRLFPEPGPGCASRQSHWCHSRNMHFGLRLAKSLPIS